MSQNPAFPYTKQFVAVNGSRMAYVDEGNGEPIVFIHGNPTSSYLWRGVIPYAEVVGRAIAIDLIGMGDSDKPDIDYRIYDQCEYFEGFIDALGLTNIHLVANDWGTAVASQYVATHRDNVKSITYVANIITPWPTWEQFGGKSAARVMWRAYREPELGWDLIVNQDLFVEPALDNLLVEKPSPEVIKNYQAPFMSPDSRRPCWQLANDLPIAGEPADFYETATNYCTALMTSGLPALLLYYPALAPAVEPYSTLLPGLKAVEVADSGHYMPEDQPDRVGEEVAKWVASQV